MARSWSPPPPEQPVRVNLVLPVLPHLYPNWPSPPPFQAGPRRVPPRASWSVRRPRRGEPHELRIHQVRLFPHQQRCVDGPLDVGAAPDHTVLLTAGVPLPDLVHAHRPPM